MATGWAKEGSQSLACRVLSAVLLPLWLASAAGCLALCRTFGMSFTAVQHSLYRWAMKEDNSNGNGNDELYPSILQLKFIVQLQRLLLAIPETLLGNALPPQWRSQQVAKLSGMSARLSEDRQFSDCLTKWMLTSTKEGNLRQVAFLGAGFDVRPSKISISTDSSMRNTHVFEVDSRCTQLVKLGALETRGLATKVKFAEVDFTSDCWFQEVMESGFAEERTFFVAQHLVSQLARTRARLLLRKLSSHCPGSHICFGVLSNSVSNYELWENLVLTLADEPIKYRLGTTDEDFMPAVEKLLTDCGWKLSDCKKTSQGAFVLAETV
eukprot:Selendium_serpulae@DN5619_c0_g1_i1.p1